MKTKMLLRTGTMTINFSECGRIWPCKCKHDQFNSATYGKKHFKKRIKPYGGYSQSREESGDFQPGVDKNKFK